MNRSQSLTRSQSAGVRMSADAANLAQRPGGRRSNLVTPFVNAEVLNNASAPTSDDDDDEDEVSPLMERFSAPPLMITSSRMKEIADEIHQVDEKDVAAFVKTVNRQKGGRIMVIDKLKQSARIKYFNIKLKYLIVGFCVVIVAQTILQLIFEWQALYNPKAVKTYLKILNMTSLGLKSVSSILLLIALINQKTSHTSEMSLLWIPTVAGFL